MVRCIVIRNCQECPNCRTIDAQEETELTYTCSTLNISGMVCRLSTVSVLLGPPPEFCPLDVYQANIDYSVLLNN